MKAIISWGGIIRPIHIKLSRDCFLFWTFDDCNGLTLGNGDEQEGACHDTLRTPAEMRYVADWLSIIHHTQRGPQVLRCENFSPEFAEESHVNEDGRMVYDATVLCVVAFITDKGRLLFRAGDQYGYFANSGVPLRLLPDLAKALYVLADAWGREDFNLGAEDPLND